MLYLLDAHQPDQGFPNPELAETEPNGLLAVGGDLSPERLIAAYKRGIFPWYSAGQPILWWSPDPRMVLIPQNLHVSRSLRKRLRRGPYETSVDKNFSGVVNGCAGPRPGQDGTWIIPEMAEAYAVLHESGIAHSVEVWQGDRLVGGLYGVALGGAFFGESMFSLADDASKVALVALCRLLVERGFAIIDCQMVTEHLMRMGAEEIPRHRFLQLIDDVVHGQNDPCWPREKRPASELANAF